MSTLGVLIPSRNEMFLQRTIKDILEHIEGDTNIIAILDGAWADPPIEDDPRVMLVYHPQSIGQRAATNEAARLSSAKFIMKCDAHCSFDQGFDVKLMAHFEDDWTVVPEMRNLHAFDWRCNSCGNRTYQGPQPAVCKECNASDGFEMVMVWKPRSHTRSRHMRFDSDLHFGYWREYKKRAGSGPMVETMSLLGACWMMTRKRYWELDGMDESHGSWGQMGTELACKSWLSGGKLLCNRTTWFAHMFRTQKGFGFPYPLSGKQVRRAREHSRWLWEGGNWEKAKYPLSWLVHKFSPVPGWEEKSKGIVYYTDNQLDENIADTARSRLREYNVVSVSLEPIDLGENIVVNAERGYLTMFKQILAGLEASTADIVYFCEHDVLYHQSHFDFVPPRDDTFYYNENCWKVDAGSGKALFYYAKQTSGLCAYRKLLLEHYRKRVEMVEAHGFTRRMGFEPGTHNRKERVDDYGSESWMSEYPNIDIRHKNNLTASRWSKDEFRNQQYTKGWTESGEVPGWGVTEGRFKEFLDEVRK